MSLLDWAWFARPMVAALPVTRASVKRLEAKTLRDEAQSVAAHPHRFYWLTARERREKIDELLAMADEADAEAARLELGL